MIGVVSLVPPPKLSNFQLHATCRFFTLSRLICSSGEYRVLPGSDAYDRHSPFTAPCCASPGADQTASAVSEADTTYRNRRDIRTSMALVWKKFTGSRLKAQASRLQTPDSRLQAQDVRRSPHSCRRATMGSMREARRAGR